jgi:1,4-alpha-glucan branching enzyme
MKSLSVLPFAPTLPLLPAPAAPGAPTESIPVAVELESLLALRHTNPHRLLGAHPWGGGTVVRAWNVHAQAILLVTDDGVELPLLKTHEAGLFEGTIAQPPYTVAYRLRIFEEGRDPVETRDPYSFDPTLGELDLHLFGEGRHDLIAKQMGAHLRTIEGTPGVLFTIWAPNAEGVSAVGDFNRWDGRRHPMRRLGDSGIWELFIPGLGEGLLYKFEIHGADGRLFLKSDPYGQAMEVPPGTASIVVEARHEWQDDEWIAQSQEHSPWMRPMSTYEVHLGSWCRVPEEGYRSMTYREIAPFLAGYVADMGFTHVEFMPLMEYPYGPSWGYQVGGYYAPTARYGSPDDFRYLIDYLHRQGIGVILDWVPAHFPKDAAALGRFDGTALYEHWDRRLGEHPDWDTYVFNYGRHEVRNFLVSNALFWLDQFHLDGLRLDAVASMLYLDYSRPWCDWIPNCFGGRENLEAIAFIKELNERVYARHPHALMVAEESTAWGGVSRPTFAGGLGFGFKWNMGWMHDTLEYFHRDPIHRRFHHNMLTFSLLYAWNENFILPLSHDEVVHGKRSLLSQMPGNRHEKFANLRALYAFMWSHPGKKLLFMGSEFGQWNEWDHSSSLDWHLLEGAEHRGLQTLVRDLNRIYRKEPALWERDFEPEGFEWLDAWSADENVLAFMRISPRTGRRLVAVLNLSGEDRKKHRIGLPGPGRYKEILNTDAAIYGGLDRGNSGGVDAVPVSHHGRDWSAVLRLPPLSVLWFEAPPETLPALPPP